MRSFEPIKSGLNPEVFNKNSQTQILKEFSLKLFFKNLKKCLPLGQRKQAHLIWNNNKKTWNYKTKIQIWLTNNLYMNK